MEPQTQTKETSNYMDFIFQEREKAELAVWEPHGEDAGEVFPVVSHNEPEEYVHDVEWKAVEDGNWRYKEEPQPSYLQPEPEQDNEDYSHPYWSSEFGQQRRPSEGATEQRYEHPQYQQPTSPREFISGSASNVGEHNYDFDCPSICVGDKRDMVHVGPSGTEIDSGMIGIFNNQLSKRQNATMHGWDVSIVCDYNVQTGNYKLMINASVIGDDVHPKDVADMLYELFKLEWNVHEYLRRRKKKNWFSQLLGG